MCERERRECAKRVKQSWKWATRVVSINLLGSVVLLRNLKNRMFDWPGTEAGDCPSQGRLAHLTYCRRSTSWWHMFMLISMLDSRGIKRLKIFRWEKNQCSNAPGMEWPLVKWESRPLSPITTKDSRQRRCTWRASWAADSLNSRSVWHLVLMTAG